MSSKRKKPQAPEIRGLNVAAKFVPGKARDLLTDDDGTLIVRFNQVDVNGPWCLSKARPEQIVEVLKVVASVETMRPLEVFKGYPGKDYANDELTSREARERLVDLKLDDQDVSCLRTGGRGRLFGFRRGRFFHVLWWDPEHGIFESRKHT